ncbi:MAG: hypothetical protein IPK59_13380 [Rhodospirillaceae bacterium]|nr:hypothetical protein [Rhodospirillaceae bacterium]
MTRFDFDVIGDTPALKSRPPESTAEPVTVPAAEKPKAQPAEEQVVRRRDNAA